MTDTSALWACPLCGKLFWQPNTWHSCGSHTVEQFLAGKSPKARAYWEKLVEMVGRCGPHLIVANKTNIGFMGLVRFAGLHAASDRGATIQFWLKERIESPRFTKIEYLLHRDWIYRVRVTSLEEMDDELQGWLCRSYEVGYRRA